MDESYLESLPLKDLIPIETAARMLAAACRTARLNKEHAESNGGKKKRKAVSAETTQRVMNKRRNSLMRAS